MQTWSRIIPIESFIEGILAIHLSSYVQSPFKDRGGLMLVGPPGVLKTSLLDVLDDNFANACSISNAFMQTMIKMQPAFYNGTIRSLAFPDIQSIYAGDPRTAGRIEQMMMQLSGEATRTIGGDQDARYSKFKSYCTIFGAMTVGFHQKNVKKWEEAGFLRRFLWATYTLEDHEVLERAICNWTRAELGAFSIPEIPASNSIRDALSVSQRNEVRSWLRHQPETHEIQLQVLCKAVSALDWHYHKKKIKKKAMHTMREFAETLQDEAAFLRIPSQEFDKNLFKDDRRKKKRRPKPTVTIVTPEVVT